MPAKRIPSLPRGASIFTSGPTESKIETLADIRAKALAAELERRGLSRRITANTESGDDEPCADDDDPTPLRFRPYRYDPAGYIEKFLGWSPWRGNHDGPGQVEILEAYTLALRQQHEQADFEAGTLLENQLQYWKPGQIIKNRLRIEAGHTVGKTKLSSGIVSHFFDCFAPSIIYTFAPTAEQIKRLLWKEIKTDRDTANRDGKGLLGRVLDTCEIKYRPDHFAIGRATDNSGGTGTERVQGQHGKYLLFDLDEAEGVADFVYDAVDSMTSGGISIVVMTANPKTRISTFYKQRVLSSVENFRISCINHPNVVEGREVVPGAVKKSYVQGMVEKHCEATLLHDETQHTFTLDFDVIKDGQTHPPGTIWKPNNEFCWRVLGIPPLNATGNTFVSVGRYEAAKAREAAPDDRRIARVGVDVARWGKDNGTLYVRHAGRVWREAIFEKQDYIEYARAIARVAGVLKALHGVVSFHVRIDAGGGFGGGVISHLLNGEEFEKFRGLFPDCLLLEVHFGGSAYDQSSYADLVTEMYAQADETLKRLRLDYPPEKLEDDLCARSYVWVNKKGVSVKKLISKDEYEKLKGRSPDDGDGCVLCIAPDHIFEPRPEDEEQGLVYQGRVQISDV
jgi:hypothetical protein